ncbi:MAG TPA: hypothetical protein VF263_24495, partial [Longimicrobiaceae bacterium]
SGPEPAINGTSPTITSATTGITLGSGNTLRGFNLGNVTGTALAGTSFGTVVVTNVGINTTGQALSLTTGTLNGSFAQLRSTGGTNNVFLSGVATTGTSTLGGAGDVLQGATGDAFVVAGGTGSFTYSGNVTQASNAAAVNVSGGHSGTLTFQTGTVSATNGTGLQFNNADGSYVFSGTNTLNGGNAGIDVSNGSSGTFTFSGSSSITNPTAETVAISNSAPTFTYSGTLSKTGSGSGITLSSNTGGTITFDGPTKVFSTLASTAVNITGNGATVVFSDSLRITTTTGAGFNAAGGGTVRVAGTHNSITSAGGTALSVVGTTIGTGGLNFRSISANGGPNGIVLDNTGATAGLTVSGTGTVASGGTIQNITGADGASAGNGVYLNNTRDVNLSWMQLNDHGNHAIRGSGVTNFSLTKTRITGTNGSNENGPFNEGSVSFTNLTGSASITGSNISGGRLDNVRVINTAGTLDRITFSSDTIGANSNLGAHGVLLNPQGSSVMRVTVQNSLFTAARDQLFMMNLTGSPTADLVFDNNDLSNNHANIVSGGGGMTLTSGSAVGSTPTLTYSITNGSFRDADGSALLISKLIDSGTFSGTINNNDIGLAGVANSGSKAGSGILMITAVQGSSRVAITNNRIRQYNGTEGILLQAGGIAQSASGTTTHNAAVHATVTGNVISNPGNLGALPIYGLHLNAGTNSNAGGNPDAYQICLNATGNSMTGSAAAGGTDFILRQRFSTTVRLPGYAGGSNDTAAAAAFVSGNNGGAGGAASVSGTGGGFVGGAACTPP